MEKHTKANKRQGNPQWPYGQDNGVFPVPLVTSVGRTPVVTATGGMGTGDRQDCVPDGNETEKKTPLQVSPWTGSPAGLAMAIK